VTDLHIECLDKLIEEGIYLNHGEIIRTSIIRTFRANRIEPFYLELREPEVEVEKAASLNEEDTRELKEPEVEVEKAASLNEEDMNTKCANK